MRRDGRNKGYIGRSERTKEGREEEKAEKREFERFRKI